MASWGKDERFHHSPAGLGCSPGKRSLDRDPATTTSDAMPQRPGCATRFARIKDVRGEWLIELGGQKARVQGPAQCWRAEQFSAVKMELANSGKATQARLFWKRPGDEGFDEKRSRTFELAHSEKVRTYRLELAAAPSIAV
jgi:hypothetical protein